MIESIFIGCSCVQNFKLFEWLQHIWWHQDTLVSLNLDTLVSQKLLTFERLISRASGKILSWFFLQQKDFFSKKTFSFAVMVRRTDVVSQFLAQKKKVEVSALWPKPYTYSWTRPTAHFLAESKSKPIGNDSEIFKSIKEICGSNFMSDKSDSSQKCDESIQKHCPWLSQ